MKLFYYFFGITLMVLSANSFVLESMQTLIPVKNIEPVQLQAKEEALAKIDNFFNGLEKEGWVTIHKFTTRPPQTERIAWYINPKFNTEEKVIGPASRYSVFLKSGAVNRIDLAKEKGHMGQVYSDRDSVIERVNTFFDDLRSEGYVDLRCRATTPFKTEQIASYINAESQKRAFAAGGAAKECQVYVAPVMGIASK